MLFLIRYSLNWVYGGTIDKMISKKIYLFLTLVLIAGLLSVIMVSNNQSNTYTNKHSLNKYILTKKCGEFAGVNRGLLASCVKTTIESNVEKIGYIATARDLEKSVELLPEINTVCHPYSHFIGRGAFNETKSIRKALFTATSFCEWGYLHGLSIEAGYVYQGKKLFDVLYDGCLYLKELKGNYFECAHGMGDSFLNSTGNLVEAIELCDYITGDDGIHLNCSQGATNYWADAIVKKVREEVPLTALEKSYISGEPYAICDQFTQVPDRAGCYDYAVRLNQVYVGGVEKFIPLCKKFKGDDLASCYKGIGREMAYGQGFSVERVVAHCVEAEEESAIAGCVNVLVTSRTQMFQDKVGKVLAQVCSKKHEENAGVKLGCDESRKGLAPYFKGKFNL